MGSTAVNIRTSSARSQTLGLSHLPGLPEVVPSGLTERNQGFQGHRPRNCQREAQQGKGKQHLWPASLITMDFLPLITIFHPHPLPQHSVTPRSLFSRQSISQPSPLPPEDSTRRAFPFKQPQSWLSPLLAQMKGISVPPPPKSLLFLLQRKGRGRPREEKSNSPGRISPPSHRSARTHGGLGGHRTTTVPTQLSGEPHQAQEGSPRAAAGLGGHGWEHRAPGGETWAYFPTT